MPAAVVYLRMSPALHDVLKDQAAASGISLNAFAIQALAAAAGPEFLRDVRAGGKPATVADEQRVLVRPERMKPIADRYVTYWVGRLGREAELAALAEVSPRGAR